MLIKKYVWLSLALVCILICGSGGDLLAQTRSDCESTRSAAERKMEEERQKEQERQESNYPDPSSMESGLEGCLGAIDVLGGGGMGGSLNLPSVDDLINGICKQAREAISKHTGGGGVGFITDVNRGGNWVRPWDSSWNESIWSALQ